MLVFITIVTDLCTVHMLFNLCSTWIVDGKTLSCSLTIYETQNNLTSQNFQYVYDYDYDYDWL